MDEIEQNDQVPGIEHQENQHGSVGFALQGQRVEMKEIFHRAKERFDTGATLAIASFPCRRGQIRGPVTAGLRRRSANGCGQRSQHLDPAFGARRNQIAIIVASVQQQGTKQGRQIFDPGLQDMTFTGTARHTSAQDDPDGGGRDTDRDMSFVAVDPAMIFRLDPVGVSWLGLRLQGPCLDQCGPDDRSCCPGSLCDGQCL